MKKEAILKWQLFIGVSVSYLTIIIMSIYLFNTFTQEVGEIRNATEDIGVKIQNLIEVDRIIMEACRHDLGEVTLNDSQREVVDMLDKIKADFSDTDPILVEINSFQKSVELFFADLKTGEDQSNATTVDRKLLETLVTINGQSMAVHHSLIELRKTSTSLSHRAIKKLESTAYFAIGIPLLFILFIFNRILKVMRELGRRSKQTHELNKEVKQVQKDIEDTNWVLTESAKLNEKINGQNDENIISELSFQCVRQSINFFAGALYIKKADGDTYYLKQKTGMDSSHEPPAVFTEQQGLLGDAAYSKEITVIQQDVDKIRSASSSLSANAIKTIIIAPLVYEKRSFGVLEIGGDYSEESITRTISYLKRVTRTMAMTIKFGQNHMLVEQLLGATQQQTEELEAQQEELRITNEDLIYKTNLLEASEEELRVQQEELRNTNDELVEKANQLAVRNRELGDSKKIVEQKVSEVEQASRYKSEFMANMSHELRTPLNSILILAKLLKDNKGSNLTNEQVKYASVIYGAGNDLLTLINDLLDLAKIESGTVELNYERIYSKSLISSLTSLFAATAADKNIELEISLVEDGPTSFLCDEYRLEQVLKNFLSNAIKFTEEHGKISLRISADKEQIYFAVRDNGKGISAEKQALIFDAFRQEDGSTSRKYGGTGLGLSISQEIAVLLGGQISLESELDNGSTFTLSIPNKQELKAGDVKGKDLRESDDEDCEHTNPTPSPSKAAETTQAKQPDEAAGQNLDLDAGKHLLIIEDDTKFADILKDFAERYGFSVMTSSDGGDGIKKAQQFKPHAIILDVMLPTADGWDVLRTLKADPETKHIPVHMMSAADFNQRDFIEKGAIGFLSKPVTEDSIERAFKNINLNIKEGVKKVLLIEDQEFQSEVIKTAFADHNINAVQCYSAQSALAKLAEGEHFDSIILDIKLPDEDGLDTLDKIKSMPRYQDTPIIINTAYDLSKEQISHIGQYTKAMVLKSNKSNSRLIDEAKLFLNKVSEEHYTPLKNVSKLSNINDRRDNLSGKKVLVADDDMRNIFALTTALESFDMEIEIANNGAEAVALVNNPESKIDIVLMDIMMPEMDGNEAIQEIRKLTKNKSLPIIAVTAKAMKGDREKSIKIGASDYISKPIDIDKLISLLRVWLN